MNFSPSLFPHSPPMRPGRISTYLPVHHTLQKSEPPLAEETLRILWVMGRKSGSAATQLSRKLQGLTRISCTVTSDMAGFLNFNSYIFVTRKIVFCGRMMRPPYSRLHQNGPEPALEIRIFVIQLYLNFISVSLKRK